MVKKSVKRANAVMMTAVFMAVMLAGFGAVAYVSTNYESNLNPDLLYQLDSNTQFAQMDEQTTQYTDFQTAQYVYYNIGNTYQYNRTFVYLGNNTYAGSINATNGISNYAICFIDMPELNNWIIDSVNITTTLNGDSDLKFEIGVYHLNDIYIAGDGSQGTIIYTDNYAGNVPSKHYDINVPLADSLRIYDLSQGKNIKAMYLSVADFNHDGFGGFSWNINLNITGKIVSDWSVQDSISTILLISGVANVGIAVIMTDSFDIGGYIKDLPKRKR